MYIAGSHLPCFEHSASPRSVGGQGPIQHESYIIYELPCLNRDKDDWAAEVICQTLWTTITPVGNYTGQWEIVSGRVSKISILFL